MVHRLRVFGRSVSRSMVDRCAIAVLLKHRCFSAFNNFYCVSHDLESSKTRRSRASKIKRESQSGMVFV